jgi:ribosomal protein S18 acetylase RimI-like enzyme
VKDGRIVGHARSNLKKDVVDIFRLYVLREFYRQGIGSAMLREVDSYFDPKFEVWLDVFEENERAVKFYLSQGYQIMQRTTEVQSEGRGVYEYKTRKQR